MVLFESRIDSLQNQAHKGTLARAVSNAWQTQTRNRFG